MHSCLFRLRLRAFRPDGRTCGVRRAVGLALVCTMVCTLHSELFRHDNASKGPQLDVVNVHTAVARPRGDQRHVELLVVVDKLDTIQSVEFIRLQPLGHDFAGAALTLCSCRIATSKLTAGVQLADTLLCARRETFEVQMTGQLVVVIEISDGGSSAGCTTMPSSV